MNDQRAFVARPHAPDDSIVKPGAMRRAPLPDAMHPRERSTVACMLIVDDFDSHGQFLERILWMAGASSIHTFKDPQLAIDRCLQVGPDLVLVDLDMPQVDGCAVLTCLRRVLPDEGFLPLVALTGATGSQARALDAGATDLLTRPCDSVEIARRVRNLLTMRALYRRVERHYLEP